MKKKKLNKLSMEKNNISYLIIYSNNELVLERRLEDFFFFIK